MHLENATLMQAMNLVNILVTTQAAISSHEFECYA